MALAGERSEPGQARRPWPLHTLSLRGMSSANCAVVCLARTERLYGKGSQQLPDKYADVGRRLASSPRRHGRVPTNDHPGTLALSVKEAVKLGATHGDGSAVRQRDTTAACINGRNKVAFRHQICFDEQFDSVHARTTALGAVNVK